MGSKGKVVSLGAAGLGFIFDPIVAGLRDRGHEVSHHIDPARFLREAGEIMRDADAFITLGSIPCSREFMLKAPRLRGIVSPFIGTESIDEAAATELGIIVANGQVPENYLSMSESTILLILACLYSLHWWERRLRDNLPHPESVPGRMLRGRTVGMIGFGEYRTRNRGAASGMGRRDADLHAAAALSASRRHKARGPGGTARHQRCRMRARAAQRRNPRDAEYGTA